MPKTMSPDLLKALQGVCYIAQHIKDADKDKEVTTFKKSQFVRNKSCPYNNQTVTFFFFFLYCIFKCVFNIH